MIIYTCPKCGHDLQSEVLTCNPPIHRRYCPGCGWENSKSEEVVRIPYSENSDVNTVYKIKDYIKMLSDKPIESILEEYCDVSEEIIDKFNECTPGYILKSDEIKASLVESEENHALI